MTKMIAFLDTNWFQHFKFPDQVDWCKLFQVDTVEIVIAPLIIRELNKHKDSPSSPRLRKRATVVLGKLDALFATGPQAPLRPGVTLRYETRDSLIKFAAYHLSESVPDDQIVANMIMQRDEQAASPVVLITDDMGLRLKAMGHGFAIHRPEPEWKLPPEEDAQEKRIKELERENTDLGTRIPKLKLYFATEQTHLHIRLNRPKDFGATIQRKVEEECAKYPKRSIAPVRDDRALFSTFSAMSSMSLLGQLSQGDIAEYNDQLDRYYARYETFLESVAGYLNMRMRSVALHLVVANDGTSPAEDLDVFLHFPDGFVLLDEDNLPERPNRPRPPAQPRSGIERAMSPSIYLPPTYSMPELPQPYDPSAPRIRRTNSYDVAFHVPRLKQQLPYSLQQLWLIFDSYDEAKSFGIEYRVNAANLPREVTGRLDVIVEQEGEAA